MFYFCECVQNKSTKQILPKTSPDNCDVQVFERVDEATKNGSINVLSLIGNAKLFGDGKVFRTKNTNKLNDFEVVETSKDNLAFGYIYSNVFADLLKNFNKYCILKFICNYIKRENTRKWRLPRFTVKTQCMIDNCTVIAKL